VAAQGRKHEGLVVRAATPRDQPTVLALNNASTPHVNALTEEQFAWLARETDYYRLAEIEGVLAGFVMAIRRGTDYWSSNYAWFTERYPAFIYLDRVVVVPNARRHGVARALYTDLASFASGRWPRITLEVNIRPPNPGSMAFHEAMGFYRVGTRSYAEGEVAMFERDLTSWPASSTSV
jgi:predicted GNAT superfamily acetyltransferase